MNHHTAICIILIIAITAYVLCAFYFHNESKVDDETTFNCIADFIDKAKTENDFELCKNMIESYFERTKSDNNFTIKFWCEMNDEYPHLFKKLEWWEDREKSEMPEYVKISEYKNSITIIDNEEEPKVHKVKKHWIINNDWRHNSKNVFMSEWKSQGYSYGAFLPATEKEYLNNNAHFI